MNAFDKLLQELDEQLKEPGTSIGPLLTDEQQERLETELFEAHCRDMKAWGILGPQVVGHEVH